MLNNVTKMQNQNYSWRCLWLERCKNGAGTEWQILLIYFYLFNIGIFRLAADVYLCPQKINIKNLISMCPHWFWSTWKLIFIRLRFGLVVMMTKIICLSCASCNNTTTTTATAATTTREMMMMMPAYANVWKSEILCVVHRHRLYELTHMVLHRD